MLEVTRLNKTYSKSESKALNNFSFKLNSKEVLGLIGESGAGKSTILKILAGVLEADSGTVSLNGIVLEKPSERLIPGYKEVQMVYQNFDLAPNFTVYENIRHPVLYSNQAYKKRRVAEVMELCDLTHLQDRFPSEISGGQQQRVALARALVSEPAVLLLDEPFSNLDKIRRNNYLKLIRNIASETEVSIVFVTHEANEALAVADKLIVLKSGNIIQQGYPNIIYHHPLNSYVAQFFGEMNIFPYEKFNKIFTGDSNEACSFFGIRPEHIYLHGAYPSLVQGEVKEVFFFGNYSYVLLDIGGGDTVYVHYNGEDFPKKGEIFHLNFDKTQVKYFWE
ncbi:ABC transporter ATP-binding protein [Chondrinema litorale]|uniref:ABC transporter ATP-binding protein n=1 Tax=Chondrinema litorale TaxID=2994555 RepID=UPI002542F6A6|nr:ABC transporter ATP-binding protein [Chondrinema litorale]UZR95889.1 ABC transporter ATP-binding protein [Chondrinema litorale]